MKDHNKYPFLTIYEDGRIFSKKSDRFLKPVVNHNGYSTLVIKPNGKSGKSVCLRIHRLVAETFIDNKNNKPHVNHKDGNKSNNHKDNLEWVSPKENMIHAYENDLIDVAKGEEVKASKLRESDIEFIRKNYKSRSTLYGCRALGKRYNVDHSTISDIINNKSWRHI